MNKKILLTLTLILVITTIANATTLLPNGEAPQCITIKAGNSTTLLDDSNIQAIKNMGINCIAVDIRAGGTGWVWTGYNTTTFTGYDDLINRAYNTYGLYIFLEPVWQGDYMPTWIDNNTNWKLNRSRYQNNYPNTTPTYTDTNTMFSIWDENYEMVQNQWYGLVADHYKNNDGVAGYINGINEGYEEYVRDTNMTGGDLNRGWFTWLTNKYQNVTQLNTAWGTNYTAITDANIPTSNTNAQQSRDWWQATSDRATYLLASGDQKLRSYNTNKIQLGVKITIQSIYTNDSGTTAKGYKNGYDINKYINDSNIDYVTIDPYPDTTNHRKQYILLESEISAIKAMADKANKPIFIGELYPTVNAADQENDTNYTTQMITQLLGYSGTTTNLGLRGISWYSWNGLSNALDIKGTNKETIITKLSPIIKYNLKYGLATTPSNIAMYDDFINSRLQASGGGAGYEYYNSTSQIIAAIDLTRQWTNKPVEFYFNNAQPSATTKTIITNSMNYKETALTDLNTWTTNGGMLITQYRNFENDENKRSTYGAKNHSTTGKSIMGFTDLTNWLTSAIYVKISTDKNIITSVAQDQNIMKYINAGDLALNYENGFTTASGRKGEADINSTTTDILITNYKYGNGGTAHLGFQIGVNFCPNQTNCNQDKNNLAYAWKNLITYKGGTTYLTTPDNNYYVTETNDKVLITAYNPTGNKTYTIENAQTKRDIVYLKISDTTLTWSAKANINTRGDTKTLNLTQGDVLIGLKGNASVNTITGNKTSSLYIDGNLITATLPIEITTNTNNTVTIDSNVTGDLNYVTTEFTNTKCAYITNINYVNTDRDINTNYTTGWTCNGNTATIVLSGIEDTNTTHKNTLTITINETQAEEDTETANCRNSSMSWNGIRIFQAILIAIIALFMFQIWNNMKQNNKSEQIAKAMLTIILIIILVAVIDTVASIMLPMVC